MGQNPSCAFYKIILAVSAVLPRGVCGPFGARPSFPKKYISVAVRKTCKYIGNLFKLKYK